jgi:hypothetical protein
MKMRIAAADWRMTADKTYTITMDDTILIAGAGKDLITAIANEAGTHGVKTAAALIPCRSETGKTLETSNQLGWNPGSPISARNLILAAENRVGALSGGIIVCAAPGSADAADFSPAGIDFIVDNHIKSYMLLARELTRHFDTARKGVLGMVLLEETSASILNVPVFSAFKSFTNSLLTNLNTEYPRMAAFSHEEKSPILVNEFAAYIFKTLFENKKLDSGRWFKFTKLKHNLKLT